MFHKILLLIILSTFYFCSHIYSQTLQWRTPPNSPSGGSGERLEDIFFINANTGWAIFHGGKVYRTTTGGNIWDTTIIQSGNALRSIGFFDTENGILGTLSDDSNQVLYRTSNHGVNWSLITNLPNPWPLGICGINIANENVAYACGRYTLPARIVKTTDKGLTWTASLIDTALARSLVDCYFWDQNNGIAVGGHSVTVNFFGSYSVILKTTDGGNTWIRVYRSSRQFEWCWKISINGNSVFASIQRAGSGISNILKTTNMGSEWQEIPFRVFSQQGIGFVNENTGWVGGFGSNYETTNGGAEWHLAGWGVNLNRIRFLSDTLAYAVGNRIYKYSREPVGINIITGIIPASFYLHQNYPNPFNPVTKIKFDITRDARRPVGASETQDVKLDVYDALGREVQNLVNQNLSPGSYEVEFDGSNFSSGIYFYELITNGFNEVKRMMLLK